MAVRAKTSWTTLCRSLAKYPRQEIGEGCERILRASLPTRELAFAPLTDEGRRWREGIISQWDSFLQSQAIDWFDGRIANSISGYCCPTHHLYPATSKMLETPSENVSRVLSALDRMHCYARRQRAIFEYAVLRDEDPLLALRAACVRGCALAVEFTKAEDAWYYYAERVLNNAAEAFAGECSEAVRDGVRVLVDVQFSEWNTPSAAAVSAVADDVALLVLSERGKQEPLWVLRSRVNPSLDAERLALAALWPPLPTMDRALEAIVGLSGNVQACWEQLSAEKMMPNELTTGPWTRAVRAGRSSESLALVLALASDPEGIATASMLAREFASLASQWCVVGSRLQWTLVAPNALSSGRGVVPESIGDAVRSSAKRAGILVEDEPFLSEQWSEDRQLALAWQGAAEAGNEFGERDERVPLSWRGKKLSSLSNPFALLMQVRMLGYVLERCDATGTSLATPDPTDALFARTGTLISV